MTFVTLECVRARVWLLPSLRSVSVCVALVAGAGRVVHRPCVLTTKTALRGRKIGPHVD